MYKIAGVNFFEASDSDQDLVRGYMEAQKQRFEENFKNIPEEVRNYSLDQTVQGIIERLENDKDPAYRGLVAYVTNNLNTVRFIKPYEDHWLKFLSSMQFDPSIITFSVMGTLSGYVNDRPWIRDDKDLMAYVSTVEDSRYLRVNKRAAIVTTNGLQYGLSEDIIKLFKKQFEGTYEEGDVIYIRYAPAQDTSVALLLNRYIHLLL